MATTFIFRTFSGATGETVNFPIPEESYTAWTAGDDAVNVDGDPKNIQDTSAQAFGPYWKVDCTNFTWSNGAVQDIGDPEEGFTDGVIREIEPVPGIIPEKVRWSLTCSDAPAPGPSPSSSTSSGLSDLEIMGIVIGSFFAVFFLYLYFNYYGKR